MNYYRYIPKTKKNTGSATRGIKDWGWRKKEYASACVITLFGVRTIH